MIHRSMAWKGPTLLGGVALLSTLALGSPAARADGNLQNVKHIVIVMQENHSFDNYFGALPYIAGTPYHNAKGTGKKRACPVDDHLCVDGLSGCKIAKKTGILTCSNSNKAVKGSAKAFHSSNFCVGPDLDHSWEGTHREVNYSKPFKTLTSSPMNGFARVNGLLEGPPQDTLNDTMGFYTDADLPFYYGLAQTFAISDRYFCSLLGQTFPNRAYLVAGTSFGHLTTAEIINAEVAAQGGYKPITGTIFDLLNQYNISWTDYKSDLAYSQIFQPASTHQQSMSQFFADAAAGQLPAVSFIDPSVAPDQLINGTLYETDEHPPFNIRAGQYFVSTIVSALRNSPNWSDSILYYTYDEHGGYYDHVIPPPAPQGGALTPDGINPGQCADNSNPPASLQPGGGLNCSFSPTEAMGTSLKPTMCPGFTNSGPYPATCPNFDQLGIRVPFVAVSPYAKPHYVSHTIGDHTSILALIEKRFLPVGTHLTARDQNANTLEDMFDFDNSPSQNAVIPSAPLPEVNDPGCPFSS